MSTCTWLPPLTISDLDSLVSLNDLALTSLLHRMPRERQVGTLRAMDRHLAKSQCRENLRKYCPHSPWPKQLAALDLDCLEVLYGGAAGPGKSDWLLMGALEWVHVPNYSAMLLRRDYQRLSLAGGLIPRSHLWLSRTDAKWNGTDKRWRFPSGATISFGYLQNTNDIYRYGSSEYQYIGWDEVTEFTEEEYTFLFSRLRRTDGNPSPLRVRAATNPGGLGHLWTKSRFMDDAALQALRDSRDGVFWIDGRAFVPGRVRDNPAINPTEYEASLSHISDPVTRARLLAGDWSVTEQGLIQSSWIRDYVVHGGMIRLLDAAGKVVGTVPISECQKFQIVDCAGSSEEIAREQRGGDASWSVCATFLWHQKTGNLIWWDLDRGRWVFPDLLDKIRANHAKHSPAWIGIEDEKTGRAALQTLRGLPTRALSHEGKDKVTRAATLLNELSCGRVWLPQQSPATQWRNELVGRMLLWTGLPTQAADDIDTAAYAAREVFRGGGTIVWHGGK